MLTNSTETVSFIETSSNLNISPSDNNSISDTKNVPKSTLDENVPKYVTLNNAEEWNEFFIMQNNTSTNTTNKRNQNLIFIRIVMVYVHILLGMRINMVVRTL